MLSFSKQKMWRGLIDFLFIRGKDYKLPKIVSKNIILANLDRLPSVENKLFLLFPRITSKYSRALARVAYLSALKLFLLSQAHRSIDVTMQTCLLTIRIVHVFAEWGVLWQFFTKFWNVWNLDDVWLFITLRPIWDFF